MDFPLDSGPEAAAEQAAPHAPAPPEELAPGLLRVAMPIPGPLGHVNCYLVRGSKGWTVVDTGYHTPQSEAGWQQVLRDAGLKPSDLEQIVVTHDHPDHFGAAGWLQQVSGAPVLMLDRGQPQLYRFWAPGNDAGAQMAEFFMRHGMPADVADGLPAVHRAHVDRVQPLPRVRWVQPQDVIAVGSRRFHVLWAPGHADGLMVLWEPDEKLLLANDLVLETITPNVSLWPHHTQNPLRQFLDSIRRVGQLPARLVLTGHLRPVVDLQRRTDELAQHHRRRLEQTLSIVRRRQQQDGRPPTAWEVQLELFGPQSSLFNTRFAMAEALAHLEYLVDAGQLDRLQQEDLFRYRVPTRAGS